MSDHQDVPDGLQLTPFDAEFFADPYPVYARLRGAEPIHRDRMSLWGRSWTVSGYEWVRRLLRDERLSVDPRRVGLQQDPRADNAVTRRPPNMMNLDDPEHRRLRGLVQKAFTPARIEQLRPALLSRAADLLADQPPTFDLVTAYAKPLPTIAIALLVGADEQDHAQFKAWTDALIMQGYPQPSEAQWQTIVSADAAMTAYFQQVVAQRRLQPQDDLITQMLQVREADDRFSDAEIVEMCGLLIGAGNFTTTDLISNASLALLTQRERWQQLQDEPASVDHVVEEVLRWDSPVHTVRRYVLQDMQVDGHAWQRGDVVNLVIAAANHDPVLTDQPEQFAPPRQCPHVSFGGGAHHCLGASLARLETQIALTVLLQHCPDLSLVSSKRNKTLGFRGVRELIVTSEATSPA